MTEPVAVQMHGDRAYSTLDFANSRVTLLDAGSSCSKSTIKALIAGLPGLRTGSQCTAQTLR